MVLLSIIIPIYNSEPYIRKTLTSIFDQPEANTEECEVITINDGTQDHAMDIVYEFSRSHNNIKIIEQDNQGQAIARNKGIKIAKGEYIWCVDSDDWIASDSLSIVSSLIRNSIADIFRINSVFVNDGLDCVEKNTSGHIIKCGNGSDIFLYCAKHNASDSSIARYIFKRSFLNNESIKFYNGIFHEDVYFVNKAYLKAKKVVITSFPIYYNRYVSTSITNNSNYADKRGKDLLLLYTLFSQMKSEYSGKERKVLDLMIYQHICRIISGYPHDKLEMTNIISLYFPQFRKIVAKHIMFDKSLIGIIHRVLFIISPSMFWKSGKHLW